VLSAAPAAIRITFSEPVTPFGRGIDVYSPSGKRVSGSAQFRDGALVGSLGDFQPLEEGTYRVEWRVVARDTHPSRGAYTFSLGHPSAPSAGALAGGELGAVAPLGLFLQTLARWLHFLGFALAFGGIAFRLLLLPDVEVRGRGAWSLLGLGVGMALVDGLAGHTIRGLPDLVAYLLTAVHEGAMALWVGGFFALLSVANRRPLLARFGRLAALSVAVLVLSGAVLALLHLRGPADLLFSPYGFTLAVKLLAVAVALGGAWFGLRSARTGTPEVVALGGVLALAALLASLPPPR